MKKTCVVFLLLAVSFIFQYYLASDKPNKKFEPISNFIFKEVESVRTLPGGLIVTLYKDGSSTTIYPSGKVVDRPPMFK